MFMCVNVYSAVVRFSFVYIAISNRAEAGWPPLVQTEPISHIADIYSVFTDCRLKLLEKQQLI